MKRFVPLTILLLAGAGAGSDIAFRVVVNEANPTSSLSLDELSDLFLKKSSQWSNGSLVVPVDQREDSKVRDIFNREVHRRRTAAVRAYWQQRIFSGRDVPPPEMESDAEVIDFVRKHPAAIGYISSAASVSGVKVLSVPR